jgi:hypothetical protein
MPTAWQVQDKKGKFTHSQFTSKSHSAGRLYAVLESSTRRRTFNTSKRILEGLSSYKGASNPIDPRFLSPSDDVQGRRLANFLMRQADGG